MYSQLKAAICLFWHFCPSIPCSTSHLCLFTLKFKWMHTPWVAIIHFEWHSSNLWHPATRCGDRLDFLEILFHIRPERLKGDRCCQEMMDEPLLKGHQGNNRQPSEPWKQQAKLGRSLLLLSSPQLSDWKMSAIRSFGNVKVVSRLSCCVLKQLWQWRWSEKGSKLQGGRLDPGQMKSRFIQKRRLIEN